MFVRALVLQNEVEISEKKIFRILNKTNAKWIKQKLPLVFVWTKFNLIHDVSFLLFW